LETIFFLVVVSVELGLEVCLELEVGMVRTGVEGLAVVSIFLFEVSVGVSELLSCVKMMLLFGN
jgi:hypothetical protein